MRVMAALALVIGMVTSGTPAALSEKAAPSGVRVRVPADLPALREFSLRLVNEARATEGLEPLQETPVLNRTAEKHARDMLARGYYGHVSPDGENVRDRFLASGGRTTRVVGENLARCRGCPATAGRQELKRTHTGWMESPGHRANILSPGFTEYGFAIVEDGAALRYSVQTFAGPGTAAVHGSDGAARALAAGEASDVVVAAINQRREEHGLAPLRVDARLTEAAARSIPQDRPLARVELADIAELNVVLPNELPWRSFRLLAGTCDGCGVKVTEVDATFFVEFWFNEPAYRRTLLSPQMKAGGVTIATDGDGRKVAVAVLAGS